VRYVSWLMDGNFGFEDGYKSVWILGFYLYFSSSCSISTV
jgi:hypothetical protein